ncbi:MAG: energy-coupling factor transporter transmembrane protein EcfT [Geodermatophilaceae bacterium]|nr:energy-coupling factor transporter transmembrane protein EcfT [Geodermatophilaceae bacterium]
MSRPRTLHPLAWWVWALGLAVAASRTTNPLLLGLVIAVAGYVVAARRPAGGWASGFRAYLVLALVVVGIRTGFHVIFGGGSGGTVLLRLPEIGLPEWVAGVRLGGAVTAEGLVAALYDGLRLATLLVCVGAAVTLADPRQLLRALPGALYELGLIVVVAVSVAPQLVEAALRVRRARALRGGSGRGLRAVRAIAMPVLGMALDRAIALAAAMDARGYGRTGAPAAATRRLTTGLLLLGLLGTALGAYGLLDTSVPSALGWPALLLGVLASVAGLAAGSTRGSRSRYHATGSDPRSALVAATGIVAGVAVVVTALTDAAVVITSAYPLAAPQLAVLPVTGILAALLPAVLAPAPARPDRPQVAPHRTVVRA